MKTTAYTPKSINTTDADLTDELLQLPEEVTENAHDMWAKTCIEQGWTYGFEHDDANKKHPCVVPYNHQPEEDRVCDCNTSIEILKLIINAGFRINKDSN